MVDLLSELNLESIKIGLPVIALASLIGNALNIRVLGQYKFRKNACSLYLTALSTNNLIYSLAILIICLLNNGQQIKFFIGSLISCKFFTYLGTVLSALSQNFVVLASIDRWCTSSSCVKRRHFSNVQTAKRMIISVVIFFSCVFSVSFVMVDQNAAEPIGCRIQASSAFAKVYGIFLFALFSIWAPFLMLLFGFLTICNVQRHRRVATALLLTNRRTETQLIRMLLVQVGTHLASILPLSSFYLILAFPNMYKPTPSFYLAFFFCRIIFHISYATPFFMYILSASMFRREALSLIAKQLPSCIYDRIRLFKRNRASTRIIPKK